MWDHSCPGVDVHEANFREGGVLQTKEAVLKRFDATAAAECGSGGALVKAAAGRLLAKNH